MEQMPGRIRFSMAAGKAEEQQAEVGVIQQGWLRQKRRLYVLAEAIRGDPELCRRAVEVIKLTFSKGKLSVTSRLTNALQAAHRITQDENSGRRTETRAGLGVTCAVVQGEDVFIAQAGPSLAYLSDDKGLQKIVPHQQDGEDDQPLGLAEELHVQLRHSRPEGDYALLLTSSALGGLVSEEDLASLVSSEPAPRMHQFYTLVKGEGHFPALLVRPAGASATRFDELWGSFLALLSWRWQEFKSTRMRMLRPTLMLLLFSLGAAILVSAAWYSRDYVTRRSEARFTDLLERAQMMQQEALIAGDRDSTRQQLEEAKGLVDAALAMRRQDAKALALEQELLSGLAKVNAVFELSDIMMVADFNKLMGEAVELSQIIIQESEAYVLDKGTGKVYQVSLKNAIDQGSIAPEVLSCPSERGVSGILWMPSGGLRTQGQLIVFDAERNFWGHDNSDFRPLEVRGVGRWSSLETAAGWQGNLYVLDPTANQVWRYYPTENGYDSEMKGILDSCDLKEAVDSAIDGSVYVLLHSGAVLKFTLGRLEDFAQGGIDKPLSTPNAIFCTPDNVFIYVVDAGNQRIVAFRRDGQFQQQLVSEHFGRLQNIFVDENKGRIYVLSDNKLYIASLPELSRDRDL